MQTLLQTSDISGEDAQNAEGTGSTGIIHCSNRQGKTPEDIIWTCGSTF